MKKAMNVVLWTGLLLIITHTPAFAESSFNLELKLSSPLYLEPLSKNEGDWHSLRFEYISETTNNKLEIEYGQPVFESATKGLIIRNGLLLNQSPQSTFWGNLSLLHWSGACNGNRLLLGMEIRTAVDIRSFTDVAIEFTPAGPDQGAYRAAKVQYHYFCTPQMAIEIGYDWSQLQSREQSDSENGWTFGLNYFL
jgi:hypothetical protein